MKFNTTYLYVKNVVLNTFVRSVYSYLNTFNNKISVLVRSENSNTNTEYLTMYIQMLE